MKDKIRIENKKEKIIELLRENGRMSLTNIWKRTGISVTSVFGYMKDIEKDYQFTIIPRFQKKGCE